MKIIRIRAGLLIAVLCSALIASPAQSAVTPQKLYDCGVSSSILCIESFQLSTDGGASWQNLTALSDTPEHDRMTPYSFAGTSYQSPDPNVNALALLVERLEVRQDAQTPWTPNNGIQTNVIAANTNNWNSQETTWPAFDPRVTFRITVRVGDLNPSYTVGQMKEINVSTLRSTEFNTLVLQGKPVELPLIENVTQEICAGPIAVAEKVQNRMQTMTFDFHGFVDIVWNDIQVAYDGSCGYDLDFRGVPDSAYPGIYINSRGPHFYPDGSTLNIGHVEVVLPAKILGEQMGLSQDSALAGGLQSAAQYVAGVDTPVSFTVTPESDGAVRVTVDGFHFSAPTVVVKRAKAGAAVFKPINASLPRNTKRSSAQVAQIFGMNPPAKSKLVLTVAKASIRAKVCKLSGGKLVTLKQTGTCTATVKVTPPKPGAVTSSGTVTLLAGQKMSAIQIASAIGMNVPAKSKVAVTIGKTSKKLCSPSSGGVKAKVATACQVKVKVQAPAPPAYAQTSSMSVD